MADKLVFRMSESGRCPRALTYQYLNYPRAEAPTWLTSSANEGKLHELWILDQLRADDIAIYGEQTFLELVSDLFTLQGHPDAYENDHGIERLVECKSLSQNEYQRWMSQGLDGFPSWAAQITCYMEATGLPLRLVVKNRNTGTIHGLDPRDTGYFFHEPPRDFADITTRLNTVAECVANGELFTSVEYDPDALECKRCPYVTHCVPPPPVLAEDQERQLFVAVENYRAGKELVDRGGEMVDRAKAILRQYAEAAPTHMLTFDELTAKVYSVKTTSYPKAEVEAVLDKETLQRIAKVSERVDMRITDKRSTGASDD